MASVLSARSAARSNGAARRRLPTRHGPESSLVIHGLDESSSVGDSRRMSLEAVPKSGTLPRGMNDYDGLDIKVMIE